MNPVSGNRTHMERPVARYVFRIGLERISHNELFPEL